MVSHLDIAQKCPAEAWAQHRFSTEIDLVNGKKIVVRFDIPRKPEETFIFDGDKVAQQFGEMMGSSAQDKDVCDAIADLLNARMKLTIKSVALHLKLVGECLLALKDERYLLSYLMLRTLATQLVAYAGDLWVYEWPEWLGLVERFILDNADDMTRQIIQNLTNHG
jgi:hypothetical protein